MPSASPSAWGRGDAWKDGSMGCAAMPSVEVRAAAETAESWRNRRRERWSTHMTLPSCCPSCTVRMKHDSDRATAALDERLPGFLVALEREVVGDERADV